FRSAGMTVQNHILDLVTQLRRDLVIDLQLAGVDDAHLQPGLDRVVEKYRVYGLAHRVVATEGEGHVRHATRGQRIGQFVADIGTGLDKVDGIIVVLLNAGGHGKDIRIEDDVFRRKADFVDQNVVGAFADLLLARGGVGLACFVKGHDHHGGTIALAQPGVLLELLDSFLHGDGVDDTLALDAFEAGFDDVPFGRVEHDRHAGNIRFAGNQIEEGHHGLLRVQHALVHVDVDHLGAGFHLLQGHFQGLGVVLLADQAGKLRRTGDVGALADVDEQRVAVDGERLQAGQATGFRNLGNLPGGDILYRFGDATDVFRGRAATAADNVHKAGPGKLGYQRGRLFRSLVVLAEGVGQTGVGVGGPA